MRTPMLAANWKMHKTVAEATAFTTAFLPLVAGVDDAEIVLAPPFTALAAVAASLVGERFLDWYLGASGRVLDRLVGSP